MPPPRRTARGRFVGGLVGLVGLAAMTGCAAQPPQSPPTGIDGLVVPTASPDPGDFVRGVDNRYLPLVPGRRWTYAVTDRAGTATRTVTVLSGRRTVAGVPVTVVRTADLSAAGRVVASVDDSYAQDRAGNVWWLGHGGADGWTAGRDGAEAGLLLPAAPRLGDGFATAEVDGHPVSVATVVDLGASAVTPYRSVRAALRIEQRDPETGLATQIVYAARLGPVQTVQVDGGDEIASLTAVTG